MVPVEIRQTAHRSLVATLQAGLRTWGASKSASMRRDAFPRLRRSGICSVESPDRSCPGTSSHRCGGSAGFSPASRFIPRPAALGRNTCKVIWCRHAAGRVLARSHGRSADITPSGCGWQANARTAN